MPGKPFQHKIFNLALALLLIAGLLSLSMPLSYASAAQSAPAPTSAFYYFNISQPKDPVCVGDSRVITVSWDTEPFSDLAPLSPSNLTDPPPTTGPRVIFAQTPRKGELDRYTVHPAGPAGTTSFTYVANHEGPEVLIFQAMDDNLKSVGQNEVTFEVKKCDYRFELFGQMDADASAEDIQFTFNYVFRAKGVLKADPNRPGYYEANSVRIVTETVITAFSAPDCALLTWTPGHGEGTVDVRGEQLGNDTMVVQFSPPKDLITKYTVSAVCDGQPISVGGQFPDTSSKDPWVEATFAYSAGIQSVQIDKFEEGVNNFKNNGMYAAYTAFVTLTPMVSK